jgi:hypothetical protein
MDNCLGKQRVCHGVLSLTVSVAIDVSSKHASSFVLKTWYQDGERFVFTIYMPT